MPAKMKYEINHEGEEIIVRINWELVDFPPSVEDSPTCMANLIEVLIEVPDATKIVFYQKRDYEYDYSQTQLLIEIALLFNKLIKQKDLFSYGILSGDTVSARYSNIFYTEIRNTIFHLLKSDPLGAYVELKRLLRREKINLDNASDRRTQGFLEKNVKLLTYLIDQLEKTRLVQIAKPKLAGYKLGDRGIYRAIFSPIIKPDFMFTKLMSTYPVDGEEMDTYTVGDDTEITIFRVPGDVRYLYHVTPPEFKLNEETYELLDLARNVLAEHKPKRSEFVDPARMRRVFYNVGRDLLEELTNYRNHKVSSKELDRLTEILVRYTVGFGLIEVLLKDQKIQDISINSPMGQITMFIVHDDFGDCRTNIIPTTPEAESWASKLRMISGRPLDEANQILDTELELPGVSTRVSVIAPPLNPTGLAYSFRRHRDKPWTLPLFMKAKMLTPLSAGLLSFLIDGTRTMLIAGTRSSGKTSLLSSLLVEIMRRYRMITVEDTLELPTKSLRKLGYNIQSMKVASALAKGTSEMSASDGIRATLRLGDSALIVGEVRSEEAIALYEAMRVGAAANVVAGTIHSDSPYGVYDRVVNDIGIPKTSFKATDIIVVANPIKSADGMSRVRRVTQITEVRKHWDQDPLLENAFVDLMRYDAKTDELIPTDEVINGESEILKTVAGNIKDFAGDWDAVWNNILLRAKTKETLLKLAEETNNMELLEAPFVIRCNDQFHLVSEKVRDEVGSLDPKRIYSEWGAWLKRELKKRKLSK